MVDSHSIADPGIYSSPILAYFIRILTSIPTQHCLGIPNGGMTLIVFTNDANWRVETM